MRSLFLIFVLVSISLFAQSGDSIKTYWLSPVEVTASQQLLGETAFRVGKDGYIENLNKRGFQLIRKGVFFAQDMYADGFHRSDISVVIDGERYHSACPNRMDSPLSRVNPLELASIDMTKTAGLLQSGFAGRLLFNRSVPNEPFTVKSALTGSAYSSQGFDGALLLEKDQQALSLHYATGTTYDDAEGQTFKDLYGYKDNYQYQLAEFSYRGIMDDFSYGASFTYTDDIAFPYLMMDERYNRVYSAHISYGNQKLYVNYTDHLMDNALRESMSTMTTEARNLTIGAVGSFYEIFYRNWDSDNTFVTPTTIIDNHLMPDVNEISATLHHSLSVDKITFSGRGGIVYAAMNDAGRLSFFTDYFSDAGDNRIFPTGGISAGYTTKLSNDIGFGALLDAAADAPQMQELYIAVNKPGTKPDWRGDPTLDQPIRATLRASLNYHTASLELFGTRVWQYIEPYRYMGTNAWQSFTNIDALIAGLILNYDWKYISFEAAYTYGENLTNEEPLAEIAPLSIRTILSYPVTDEFTVSLSHLYNDAQTRVSETLWEKTTPAFNRIDLGIAYDVEEWTFSVAAENITNELYYHHLSYMRNPFSTGTAVYEPGTTIRLNILYARTFGL